MRQFHTGTQYSRVQSTVPTPLEMPRGFDEAPQYGRATAVQGLVCPGSVDAPAETEAGESPPWHAAVHKRADGLRQKYPVLRRREPGARHQLFCCCLWWTNRGGCCQHLHSGELGRTQCNDLELGGSSYSHPAVLADTCDRPSLTVGPPRSRSRRWAVALAFAKLPSLARTGVPSPAKPRGSQSCSRSRGLGSRSRALP